MKTSKTTIQLIQELPQDVKDDFIELLAGDAERFEAMGTDKNLSYSNWFMTYVISDDFRSLNNEEQKNVFSHYENTTFAIRIINEFFNEHDVINYN